MEFCLIAPGQCSSIIPENQIFLLHFLFSMDDDKNAEFLRKSKAINKKLGAVYESKGLKVLNFFNEGAMYWTANKPLRKPEDFEGVKFRVIFDIPQTSSFFSAPSAAGPQHFEVLAALADYRRKPFPFNRERAASHSARRYRLKARRAFSTLP